MDGFGLFCAILSMLLMVIFNFICIKKYGLLSCFSAYGEKWEQFSKEHPKLGGLNLWSLITVLSALLLVPPILVSSTGSMLQFICFFCPLYLLLVGFTPDYAIIKKHYTLHLLGVIMCILSVLIWLVFIVNKWFILIPVFLFSLIIGMGTRTFDESYIYYLEMFLYLTAYITLIFL